MKKRRLGTSNIYVSELGFGCMSLPTNLLEANRIVDIALDAGIQLFDTADLYDGGINEEIVGKVLKDKRQQIVLSTKVGNRLHPDGNGWSWDPSKHHIINGVKESLRRLQTDYIDLYQLHGGTMEDNYEETIDAFDTLKQEGVIREYGISSIRPTVIQRFLQHSDVVSIMMQYSILDRKPEEWFPMIREGNASVITRGTLAKGLLTAEGSVRAQQIETYEQYRTPDLQEIVNVLQQNIKDVHAAAIAFTLHNDTVASALVGARTSQQIHDSISAYFAPPSTDELNWIATNIPLHRYEAHRPQ